jgi:hypothetical protein
MDASSQCANHSAEETIMKFYGKAQQVAEKILGAFKCGKQTPDWRQRLGQRPA